MKIEILTQLLKDKKDESAYAYIPEKSGKPVRGKVAVVFQAGGKVYEYKGDIHDVAERLGLIPTIEHWSEAMKVVNHFASGNTTHIISFSELSDTIYSECYKKTGIEIRCIYSYSLEHHTDEYDRGLSEYALIQDTEEDHKELMKRLLAGK